MSQYSDPHSAVPSSFATPPNRPQVVHVVARPGGWSRAVGFILGMFAFGAVFAIGLTLGIMIILAAEEEGDVVKEAYRDGGSKAVAVIPVEGIIDAQQAEFVHAAVDAVLDDRDVKAVVLRVDSPGGGVTASDQIWYEIERIKKRGLPVVASYGSVAASGGYYISCAADHIMAEETTITGSIGVIAQVLTLEDLMDKIGVQPVTLVATNSPEKSVANDIFRSWNDRDKTTVRTMLDAAYETFNKRVRDGRKTVLPDYTTVNTLANGSIYTAAQAKENGLIDSIGYLNDAIAAAETRGGVTAGMATVYLVRRPDSLMEALLGGEARGPAATLTPSLDADSIRALVNDLAAPRIMYLMH